MARGLLRDARQRLKPTAAEQQARDGRYQGQPRFKTKPLTQDEMAARLGVTPKTIKDWEKADSVPADRAEDVARAYGVDPQAIARPSSAPAGLEDLIGRLESLGDAVDEVLANQREGLRLLRGLRDSGARIQPAAPKRNRKT